MGGMEMTNSQYSVNQVYNEIIDCVTLSLASTFLYDGIDDGLRQEMRTRWKEKLEATGAVTDYVPVSFCGQKLSSINGIRVEPIRFMPQNSATLVSVMIQLTQGGDDRTFNLMVPSGVIQSRKIDAMLNNPELMGCLLTDDAKEKDKTELETLLQEKFNAELNAAGICTTGPKKRQRQTRKKRNMKKGTASKVENEGEDQEVPQRKPKTRKRKATKKKAKKVVFKDKVDDGDEEAGRAEEDSEEDVTTKKRKVIKKPKKVPKKDEDEDEEDKDDFDFMDEDDHNDGKSSDSDYDYYDIPQGDGGVHESDDNADEEKEKMDQLKMIKEAQEKLATNLKNLYDTENVIICQYEKVARRRTQWKFLLKDGIMKIRGKDYIFNRAMGQTVEFQK